MKKAILILLAFTFSLTAFSQKKGFPKFSFTVQGDNHTLSPYQCNDPIVFHAVNANKNQWYEIIFPANVVTANGISELALISDYVLTDSNGDATYVFNGNGCIKYNGEYLFSQQDQYGWKILPGAYTVYFRWWISPVPVGKAQIIID